MSLRLNFVALALLAAAPVAAAYERLLGWNDGMGMGGGGGFNITEFIDKMKDINYTDIFDRCCPTNTTVLPGTTQYDLTSTESCNCPVRNNETFADKWDDSCTNKLGQKIVNGETGFDLDKLTEMFEKFMNKNYTDIYDRCCPGPDGTNTYDSDPGACKCPVRDSTEHMAKWEYKCENKYAVKAAAGGGDYSYDGGKYNFDGGKFNFEVKNYTAVYMNCCQTLEGLPITDYDVDAAACSCPVRQDEKFAEKWTTKCEDTYGPKAAEEMLELPTLISAKGELYAETSAAAASWRAFYLIAAVGVSVLATVHF